MKNREELGRQLWKAIWAWRWEGPPIRRGLRSEAKARAQVKQDGRRNRTKD